MRMPMPQMIPQPLDPASAWPEPDLTIDAPERPPAPVIGDERWRAIFGPWGGWLERAARAKSAHRDYVALGLLSTSSACLAHSRWAQPAPDWKEPPMLWAMLVGDPSAGKSPALDVVLNPVAEIEQGFAQDYADLHSQWSEKAEIAALVLKNWKRDAEAQMRDGMAAPARPLEADPGAEPVRERIRMSDATIESVAEVLAGTGKGVLLSRDELSGWIEGMNRYADGGDRPFWLEAYGGRPYTVDRKSRSGPLVVKHLSVAVLGGTQPDRLDSLLVKADDDGLLARFLIAFPDPVEIQPPGEQIDYGPLNQALKQMRCLAGVPDDGGERPQMVHFDADARDLHLRFRRDMRAREAEAYGPMKGFIGKMPGVAARLALVLSYLDWSRSPQADAAPPESITRGALDRALVLIVEVLIPYAERAYGQPAAPVAIRGASRIASWLKKDRPLRFTVRELQQKRWRIFQSAKEIEQALQELEQAEWVRRESEDTGGGRKKIFYAVNPRVLQ